MFLHMLYYQVPPTPKEMGKEKEGRVEKEKPDKKKEKQKPPPDDEVGLCCHMTNHMTRSQGQVRWPCCIVSVGVTGTEIQKEEHFP